MFKRAHHNNIVKILSALDSTWLSSRNIMFGGGTAIYRISRPHYLDRCLNKLDIDDSYRQDILDTLGIKEQ